MPGWDNTHYPIAAPLLGYGQIFCTSIVVYNTKIQWYSEKVQHVNITHTSCPSGLCHSELTQSVKTTKLFDTFVIKCKTDTYQFIILSISMSKV